MQQREWHGSPLTTTWRRRWRRPEGSRMTAIASVYTPLGFIIAADGRCRSDDELSGREYETDNAQKIFPIENEDRVLAYSLIGFGGTNDGKFKSLDEIAKVSATLANRRFNDIESYIHRF